MSESKPRFSGLILGGGQGRRWGGPKAWAEVPDGRTFLESCVAMLAEAGAQPIVATLPPGASAPGIEALALPEDGLDMFASLRLGLGRLLDFDGWELVVMNPVDHPLVTSATVRALVKNGRSAAIATVRGKHGHPICLARNLAERVVSDPNSGPTLRHVLREAGAIDVSVDDFGVISNCNTPEMMAEHLERIEASR